MYRVAFSLEAEQDIREIRAYITQKNSRRVADAYLYRLRQFCRELGLAPHRGEQRSELAAYQRSIGFEHRISVVFRVYDDQKLVRITGVHYGGQEREPRN